MALEELEARGVELGDDLIGSQPHVDRRARSPCPRPELEDRDAAARPQQPSHLAQVRGARVDLLVDAREEDQVAAGVG